MRGRLTAVALVLLLSTGAALAQPGWRPEPTAPPETLSPAPLPAPDLEEAEDERLAFSYPMPAERGGGFVTGRTSRLETAGPQQIVLTDRVELHYQNMVLQGDRLELDLEASQVRAAGNVVFDQGPRRVTAESIEFDLSTETGTFYGATAYLDPDFYFRARRVDKVGEATYVIRRGVFTSCSGDSPAWSFAAARARVTIDGYARASHTAMRAKKLPLLYFPYILWPVKQDRTSGFLIPSLGYTEHRGGELGLAYYQTLGNSADATLSVDLFEEDFLAYGLELRYQPTPGTSGFFQGYAAEVGLTDAQGESLGTRREQRFDFLHDSQDLPGGLRGVVRAQHFSDFDFLVQEFERRFTNRTRRSIYSSAYLSGSWSAHSLTALVDHRETFLSDDRSVTQLQLPSLDYRLRTARIGRSPFFFSLRSAGNAFVIEPSEGDDIQYERADFEPQLSFPFSTLPWLSMTLNMRSRFTFYTDSLDEETGQFSGETLTRNLPGGDLQILGPTFTRVYQGEAGPFSGFKHIIEPQIQYTYQESFEDQNKVPRFDGLDNAQLFPTSIVTVGIVNRLLAKPKPPRELLEAIEAAQRRSAAEREASEDGRDETDTGEGEIEESPGEIPGVEQWLAELDATEDASLPSVSDQLDREDALEVGMTEAMGSLDTFSQQAALMAATTPREILSLAIAQSRTFEEDFPLETARTGVTEENPEFNLWGPVVASLRFNPSSRLSLDARVDYSPLYEQVTSRSLSGGWSFGRDGQHGVGLSWFTRYLLEVNSEDRANHFLRNTDQVRFSTGFELWPRKLRLGYQVNYRLSTRPSLVPGVDENDEPTGDLVRSEVPGQRQDQSLHLRWTGQCVGLDLSYFERYEHRIQTDISEVRLAITLRNVGTFLDLKSGIRGAD